MFEKFTQKAIEIVTQAQEEALKFGHSQICSEHLLLALYIQTKGVQAKILGFDKVERSKLIEEVNFSIGAKINPSIPHSVTFSQSARNILDETLTIAKKYSSRFILPQHIALALFSSKNSGSYKVIKKFDLDEEKIISNLTRLLDKNKKDDFEHPESAEESTNPTLQNINNFFKEKNVEEILNNAASKLSTCGYEILGTEQILQSILENENYDVTRFLEEKGITKELFLEKLNGISSRSAEFENSEKQVIFTPNAFKAMILAIDSAKELGSVEIKPEHILLGMIKSKEGIAYNILKDIIKDTSVFEEKLTKEITGKTPEMLSILRLAKEEANNINRKYIGTEMLLLGILAHGTGIGAIALHKLGITLKDARYEVEKLVGYGSEPNEENVEYTPRAKKALECAYEIAKSHNKTKIMSENLLYAITRQKECLAMKVLEALGTDVLEIKYGIRKELEAN